MATNNQGNQSFKQIEGESWLSTYLPALSAGTVMAVVLLLAISCSKKSDNTAKIKAPEGPVAVSSTPSTSSSVAPAPAPKKVKKVRPANATYVNSAYGVSFSYPRKYSLQAGNGKSTLPVSANFVKPGAIEIASVDMPDSTYTDTDFTAGLINVAVNPGMSADECAQFVPNSDAKSAEAPKPETLKIGSNEFTVIEQMSGEMEHQSDLKYFHLFKNGACYEFAMDVETSRKPDEDLAQVDRGKVFQQLSKIFATVRIKEVQLPRIENADNVPATSSLTTAPAATAPATITSDSKTEKAQVEKPEHK